MYQEPMTHEDEGNPEAGIMNGLLLMAAFGSLGLAVWDMVAGAYLSAALFGLLFVAVMALLAVELR